MTRISWDRLCWAFAHISVVFSQEESDAQRFWFYGFSFQRSLGISIFLISKVVRIISALPTLSRCGGDLMRSLKLNVCTLLGVISGPVMTCLGLRCTNDVSVFSSASGRHHQLILALLLAQLGYNLTIVFSTILHTAYTTN